MSRLECSPLGRSYEIDSSPGNGTRYRLIVTIDAGCIRSVAWPDSWWSAGDFGPAGIGAEWLEHSGRLGQADAKAIAAILAARPWLEPEPEPEPEVRIIWGEDDPEPEPLRRGPPIPNKPGQADLFEITNAGSDPVTGRKS